MGTWVEIVLANPDYTLTLVVPRMGTWVEIMIVQSDVIQHLVVPRMGTWVEMMRTNRLDAFS